MKFRRLAVLAIASGVVIPATAALAQSPTNNPNNAGGAAGSQIGSPSYPAGSNPSPALSGKSPTAHTGAAGNPHQAGATGKTIVPGDKSTISSDKQATTRQKTGAGNASGS